MKEEKFDLVDISLVPSIISDIKSRKECNPKYINGSLPLIAAPMDTVINNDNIRIFIKNGISVCIPREYKLMSNFSFNEASFTFIFKSFSLDDIERVLSSKEGEIYYFHDYSNISIDIANGHMRRLVDITKEIKNKYPYINLMVGNVAHPLTFKNLAMAGADYIRCGIGVGNACLTSANIGINYPMGSLINECRKIKEESQLSAKIIADGGMKSYDDIIKVLALGSDYVTIGSIFNKAIESAGFNYLWKMKISQNMASILWKHGFPIKKKYRGLSTKSVQRNWGKTELVTAEGITKYQKVEYTLEQWTENFKDYLCSAMSYCNTSNLDEFIGEVDWIFITPGARERFNK